MLHVDENHPGVEELLKRRAFNVARSFIPRNTCVVDKKIIKPLWNMPNQEVEVWLQIFQVPAINQKLISDGQEQSSTK